jgi:hypothetical protein
MDRTHKPNMERKSLLDMEVAAGGKVAAAAAAWLSLVPSLVAAAVVAEPAARVAVGTVIRGLAPLRTPMAARGIKAKLERTGGARDIPAAVDVDEEEADADADEDADEDAVTDDAEPAS